MTKVTSDRGFAVFVAAGFAALLAIAGVNLWQARTAAAPVTALSYSGFLDQLGRGRVASVRMSGALVDGRATDGSLFRTYAAEDPDLIGALRRAGVRITAVPPPAPAASLGGVVAGVLPMLLIAGLAVFFLRRQGGVGGGSTLGRSRARLLGEGPRVTFADVAGVDEARDALAEIVAFLRDPGRFTRMGGRIPRGVLLVGPPGTGKTLLARAIAGEAGVPFFTISGSDFVEMFVGVGASRVRAMFEQARKVAPSIVFVDEIDAVGRRRGAGVGGGNDEREQTLNQLLVEMDGFAREQTVILIAATNRPDVLDPALLRPGRFDREIVVDHPDVLGRERILAVHGRGVVMDDGVDLGRIAAGTAGFSGADLMNLVNEAALLAVRRGRDAVGMEEFEAAKDTVVLGAERRTHAMTAVERRLAAYREGGRVVVAAFMPAAEAVAKATIVTRGRSAGRVLRLQADRDGATTVVQLRARLAVLMAGRAAEALVFGEDDVTAGAAGEIEQATRLARMMVTRWGLSARLGAVAYAEEEEDVFLGNSIARAKTLSEATAEAILGEIRGLIDRALAEATGILVGHRGALDRVAETLLAQETLTGAEIAALLR